MQGTKICVIRALCCQHSGRCVVGHLFQCSIFVAAPFPQIPHNSLHTLDGHQHVAGQQTKTASSENCKHDTKNRKEGHLTVFRTLRWKLSIHIDGDFWIWATSAPKRCNGLIGTKGIIFGGSIWSLPASNNVGIFWAFWKDGFTWNDTGKIQQGIQGHG